MVGRLAAKTSTTLEMARRLIQPMLVKGEHDYSFISQDGKSAWLRGGGEVALQVWACPAVLWGMWGCGNR